MKITEKLQAELDALIAEREKCNIDIEKGHIAQKRLNELNSYWVTPGEIDEKRQEVEDSRYPVWDTSGFRFSRIVSVTDKWVSIKMDGIREEITRYKVDTGRRERTRDDSYKIDVKKAIEIWVKHKNETHF